MIVLELLWAAATALSAYYFAQWLIHRELKKMDEEERKRIEDEETRPLREEPPWGSATDQFDDH